MEEKLTDIEREHMRKTAGKITRRSLWVAAASLACTAGAIWFGDWRLIGLAALLGPVSVILFVVSYMMTDEMNEARWAKTLHTAQRAKKAKEEQDRQRVADLERDLFGAEG